MKYESTFLTIKCKPISIKSIIVKQYTSKELALGSVYNDYGISYYKEIKKSFICCDFQFGWTPTQITFAIVSPIRSEPYVHYDFSDIDQTRKARKLIADLIEVNRNRDFGGSSKAYPDKSMEMSDWHWKYSIPKGFSLLSPGDIILESDREYCGSSYRNAGWMDAVSWYNIGKVVGKTQGCVHVGEGGKIISTHEGHPDPLICRKK